MYLYNSYKIDEILFIILIKYISKKAIGFRILDKVLPFFAVEQNKYWNTY